MKKVELEVDLSLNNTALYRGCKITERNGIKHLDTPMAKAVGIVRSNALEIFSSLYYEEEIPTDVVLTGRMATWVYLTVFAVVVVLFKARVWYKDSHSLFLVYSWVEE